MIFYSVYSVNSERYDIMSWRFCQEHPKKPKIDGNQRRLSMAIDVTSTEKAVAQTLEITRLLLADYHPRNASIRL